jgi:anti-anti-sigma factor
MTFFFIGGEAPAQVVEQGEDFVVLVAGGELDYAASPEIRAQLAEHINAGMRRLVFDLSTVTFIDSTAIGALAGAAMRLQKLGGGSLAVVCAEENERVLRIFEIAGVTNVITLHRSREEALSALAVVG